MAQGKAGNNAARVDSEIGRESCQMPDYQEGDVCLCIIGSVEGRVPWSTKISKEVFGLLFGEFPKARRKNPVSRGSPRFS